MAAKSTSLRDPVPVSRFVLMAAFRTAGTRSSFRPAEARNAGVFTLVVEVLDVLAVLPLGHPLVMFSTTWRFSYPIWIPDIEIRYFVCLAEVNHLTGALVPHVPDTTFGAECIAVPRTVQRMLTLRPLLAPGQLASKRTVHLIQTPFLRAYSAAGHNQTLAGIGSHRTLVNLSQIHGRVYILLRRICDLYFGLDPSAG
jgi:hypothetical protein